MLIIPNSQPQGKNITNAEIVLTKERSNIKGEWKKTELLAFPFTKSTVSLLP